MNSSLKARPAISVLFSTISGASGTPATAPTASSGCCGAPILRANARSRGAESARATSAPTGTPPRGKANTTGQSSFRTCSCAASSRPASARSANITRRRMRAAEPSKTITAPAARSYPNLAGCARPGRQGWLLFGGLVILGCGHFRGSRLGSQALRLTDPIILLDPPGKGKGFVEIGDVIIGEIGDLFELDGAELIEAGGQFGVYPLDPGKIIGLTLGPLEALEGGVQSLGAGVGALKDTRRFASPSPQIIELGAAHLAAAQDFDLGDVGGVDRKHALHTLAVGNLAHRETFVDAAAGARDHHALIGLQAKPGPLGLLWLGLPLILGVDLHTLDDFDHHLDGIAGAKLGHGAFGEDGADLLALELQNGGHGGPRLRQWLPARPCVWAADDRAR